MQALGILLMVAGGALSFIGGLWFLVVAFRESILWGLACIFLPFVSLFFLMLHWDEARKPFLASLLGTLVCVLSVAVGAVGA